MRTGYFVLLLLIPQFCGLVIASEVRDPTALDLDAIVYLDQNWSAKERQWFYHADQGSQLMSYDIFIALEQADNEQLS